MRALPPPLRLAPSSRAAVASPARRGALRAFASALDPSRRGASAAGAASPLEAAPWAQGVAEYRRRRRASAPPPPAVTAPDPVDALLSAFGVADKAQRLALQRRRGVFLHADLLARRLTHLQTLLGADAADMAQLLSRSPDGGALAELPLRDVASRLAGVAAELPQAADVAAFVVEEPALLLHADAAARVRAALRAAQDACPGADVAALAGSHPAAMAALLAELDETGGAIARVTPMLRAWFAGSLGVR